LLELGCGSGALSVALLESGAVRADGVDLSAESVAAARRRAETAGVAERASFNVGDAARVDLAPHDWLVMDRVICCYPDVDDLLGNAIPAASKRFAFSVPTSRGARGLMNRFWWGIEKKLVKVMRGACPGYVHSLDLIEGKLSAAGFRLRTRATGWMWYVAVWERAESAA
jgi:magnesium-protoporphyrin O-methyltransferase